MLLKSVQFIRGEAFYHPKKRPGESLCRSMFIHWLRQGFVLPINAPKMIWIQVYDQPSSCRLGLRVRPYPNSSRGDQWFVACPIPPNKRIEDLDDERTDFLLRPYKDRTIYIGVEYEE